MLCQRFVVASNQCDREVVRRNQEPSLQTVSGTEITKKIDFCAIVAFRPRN